MPCRTKPFLRRHYDGVGAPFVQQRCFATLALVQVVALLAFEHDGVPLGSTTAHRSEMLGNLVLHSECHPAHAPVLLTESRCLPCLISEPTLVGRSVGLVLRRLRQRPVRRDGEGKDGFGRSRTNGAPDARLAIPRAINRLDVAIPTQDFQVACTPSVVRIFVPDKIVGVDGCIGLSSSYV